MEAFLYCQKQWGVGPGEIKSIVVYNEEVKATNKACTVARMMPTPSKFKCW